MTPTVPDPLLTKTPPLVQFSEILENGVLPRVVNFTNGVGDGVRFEDVLLLISEGMVLRQACLGAGGSGMYSVY